MGGHISPQPEKANMAVIDTFAGPSLSSKTFLSPCMLKLFQPFGIIENLIHHH
jgi:hypothetical protein